MNWFAAGLVGMAGGGAIEAVDVYKSVRWHSQMPWNVRPETVDPPRRRRTVRPGEENLPRPGAVAYLVAVVIRLMVSAVLPAVIAATFPLTGNPLTAFLGGVGALATVEKLVSLVPLMVRNLAQSAFGLGGDDRRPRARAVLPPPGSAAEGDPA